MHSYVIYFVADNRFYDLTGKNGAKAMKRQDGMWVRVQRKIDRVTLNAGGWRTSISDFLPFYAPNLRKRQQFAVVGAHEKGLLKSR